MNQKKIFNYMLVILTLFLVMLVSVFFANKKVGMYEDEVVTYGLANSHYATWISDIKDEYINGNMTERVVSKQDFLSYLSVDKGERFDFKSVYINQSNDVHPPLYYELLNFFCSFKINTFSKWPGLVLNIILYLLSIIFLYFCLNRIFENEIISAFAVMFYGLSFFGISTMLFIRMYILLTLMTILLTYEIVVLLKNEKKHHYITIGITVLGGMLTQYNFAFFAFFITLFTFLYLIINKNIKKAFKMGMSALIGVCGLFICYPYFFKQIKEGANGGTVSGESTIKKFLNFKEWFEKIKVNGNILISELKIVITTSKALLIILFIFMIIYFLAVSKKKKDCYKNNKIIIALPAIIIVSTFVSFVFIAITIPGASARYFYHLVPFVSVFIGWELYLISFLWSAIFNEEKIKNYLICFSMIFVVSLNLQFLKKNQPDFLFSDFNICFENISKYESSPCVYVDAGYLLRVHDETLQFLIKSDDVFISKQDSLNSDYMEKYIANHTDNDNLLLYIDGDIGDKDFVVESIMNSFDYTEQEFLFATQRSTIVRLIK